MKILDLHKKFRRQCALEEGLRPKTVNNYKVAIKTFVNRTGVVNIGDVTVDVVKAFFYEGMETHQWGFYSHNNHRNYLNKFFAWCVEEKYLKMNPIAKIKKLRRPRSLPRRLSYEEAQRILNVAHAYPWRYEFEHARNYALIAIMLYAGLRLGEVLTLQVSDVDLGTKNIFVRQGKGGKDRNVPVHGKLAYILKEYLCKRDQCGKMSQYLFVAVRSELPLSQKNVYSVCKKVGKAAGVDFTPHRLRHTFASVAIEQGMGVVQLKAILGHADLSTVMIYTQMSSKNLQEKMGELEMF